MGAVFASPKLKSTDIFSKLFQHWDGNPLIATQDDYPAILQSGKVADWWKSTVFHQPEMIFLPLSGSVTGPSSAFAFITLERTSTPLQDVEMDKLEAASRARDEQDFVSVADRIAWDKRPAEDILNAVQLSLFAGAHLKARQLAMLGADYYPDHVELQKYARILAPPKVLSSSLPADPGGGADIRWLKTHAGEYRGQWVALKAGELLVSANTMDELVRIIGNPKGTGILITKVD